MKNPADLARLEYVFENYDDMLLSKRKSRKYKNSDNTAASIVLYNKRVNGYYYVAEATPDSKAKALYISAAYKNKNLQESFASKENFATKPVTPEAHPAIDTIIRNNSENVNPQPKKTQHSVSNSETERTNGTDSDGKKLTEAQIAFFKDSKVRDEDGNLLVVYHGTTERFNTFDMSKGRANMDIQGAFFSPWELDAKGYGDRVRAFYLNITNPAGEKEAYGALKRFQGENNTGIKAREYLKSLGYDGVNGGEQEYVSFSPSQIKLTNNLTPTRDADIRYSVSTVYESDK